MQAQTLALLLVLALAPAQQERRPAPSVPANELVVTVVDERGEPVVGADVAARPSDVRVGARVEGGLRLTGLGWRHWRTTSDAAGRATLTGLEPGSWHVAAGRPLDFGYHFSEPVEPGRTLTLALEPLDPARFVRGKLVGPHGTPVEAATVRYYWRNEAGTRSAGTRTDADGAFVLVADEPAQVGGLVASAPGLATQARDALVAGAGEIELALRHPKWIRLLVHDQFGAPVEDASAEVRYELAGRYVDAPRPRAPGRRSLQLERPPVPARVRVQAPGCASRSVELSAAEAVGAVLSIELWRHPRLRGRVTQAGEPVPGASVHWQDVEAHARMLRDGTEAWRRARGWRPWRNLARTDEAGRFDVPWTRAVRARVLAAHLERGSGTTAEIELLPEALPAELHVPLTRATGTIAGELQLPPGREPHAVWLTTSVGNGWMRVRSDGHFELPGLLPGLATVRALAADGLTEEPRGAPDPDWEPRWFSMSHTLPQPPEWLVPAWTFDVVVRAGETVHRDLDLVTQPPCRLEGRLLVDGTAPAPVERDEFELRTGLRPARAHLQPLDRPVEVGSCELGPNGRFRLAVHAAGRYLLCVEVPFEDAYDWIVMDVVELGRGSRRWDHDLPTGALELRPAEGSDEPARFGGHLRWQGPGALRVHVPDLHAASVERSAGHPRVPAGSVELYTLEGRERRVRHTAGLVVGETTVLRVGGR